MDDCFRCGGQRVIMHGPTPRIVWCPDCNADGTRTWRNPNDGLLYNPDCTLASERKDHP